MATGFFLTRWLFYAMRWLYENPTQGSVVLTVIIATIAIKLITIIGDIKSRQSSLKMAAVQPQLDKLRKKYGNDPQRLNLEQRKFMKANGVSMFGGCLPMLFTLPLFFMFIAAFRQWGNEMTVKLIYLMDTNPEQGIEFFESFKFLWINNIWAADSGLAPVIAKASSFFSAANKKLPDLLYFAENPEILQWFKDVGFIVQNEGTWTIATYTENLGALYDAILQPCADMYAGHNNGWFILPVLAGGTTFLASWVMTRKQPKNEAAGNTGKIMQYGMPIFTAWICLNYNSAFALYWTISNAFSVLTSLVINAVFEKKKREAEANAQ